MKTYCVLSHHILSFLDCEIDLIKKPESDQMFYSITQVSELIKVQPHVIRYWEKHFPLLNPGRGSSSNWRNYVAEDIEILRKIDVLINEKGMTISGAQKILPKLKADACLIDALESIVAEIEAV